MEPNHEDWSLIANCIYLLINKIVKYKEVRRQSAWQLFFYVRKVLQKYIDIDIHVQYNLDR